MANICAPILRHHTFLRKMNAIDKMNLEGGFNSKCHLFYESDASVCNETLDEQIWDQIWCKHVSHALDKFLTCARIQQLLRQ